MKADKKKDFSWGAIEYSEKNMEPWQWAWEFLRRSDKYQDFYKRVQAIISSINRDCKEGTEGDVSLAHWQSIGLFHKDALEWIKDELGGYGLSDLIDPEIVAYQKDDFGQPILDENIWLPRHCPFEVEIIGEVTETKEVGGRPLEFTIAGTPSRDQSDIHSKYYGSGKWESSMLDVRIDLRASRTTILRQLSNILNDAQTDASFKELKRQPETLSQCLKEFDLRKQINASSDREIAEKLLADLNENELSQEEYDKACDEYQQNLDNQTRRVNAHKKIADDLMNGGYFDLITPSPSNLNTAHIPCPFCLNKKSKKRK